MSLVGKRNYFSFDFIPVIVIDLIRIYFSVRSTSLEQKFFFFFFLVSTLSFPPVDRESLDRASIRFIEYTAR